jgi:DNA-directed RNA polymerase specialized sigma24 family protein
VVSMSDFAKRLETEIPRLRRYARALTRDPVRADDLVQDCLVRAIAKQHLWQPETNLRACLFTILHNQNINDIRRFRPCRWPQPGRLAGRVGRPGPARGRCFRPQARLAGHRDNQGDDRATLAATVVVFKPTVPPRNPAASKYRVVPTSW